MARIKLEHVNAIIDRYGKVRYYFRRRGCKNVRLPGLPGSAEFMDAYAEALDGATAIELGVKRCKRGTIAAAVLQYFASTAFADLAPTTQVARRNILERFVKDHGDKRLALLERRHIEYLIATKADHPGTANTWFVAIRSFLAYAVEVGLRHDDPTTGVRRLRVRSDGIYAWSEDDIAAFAAKHPIGSRARLALALLLYTGQRRSDVLKLGRQHLRNGILHLRQQKTGAPLAIPIHPELKAVLDATPSGNMPFLITKHGRAIPPTTFSHWFKDKCREAGLPERASVHGLRKAAAGRLVEAGATAHEVRAITGHASLREIERYTSSASQERLARAAVRKLVEGGS